MVCLAIRRIAGCPVINYFDDFCGIAFGRTREEALHRAEVELAAIVRMIQALGIQVARDKDEFGSSIEWLGLIADFLAAPQTCVPPAKVVAVRRLLQRVLDLRGSVDSDFVARLGGKLWFISEAFPGLASRSYVYPFARRASGCSVSNLRLVRAAEFWVKALSDPIPTRAYDLLRPRLVPIIVYSDASIEDGGLLGTVVIDPVSRTGRWSLMSCTSRGLIPRKKYITPFETISAVAAIDWAHRLFPDRHIICLVDNQAAMQMVQRGYTRQPDISAVIQALWLRMLSAPGIWFEWVPTEVNIADLPTRSSKRSILWKHLGFDRKPDLSWRTHVTFFFDVAVSAASETLSGAI
jgi:hypothetical protein